MGVRAQECCRVADSVKSDVDALRASQVKSLRASHAMRWEAVLGAWLLQLVDRKPITTYCPAPEPCHCECLIEVAKPESSSSEWRAVASGLGGLAAGSGLTFWASRQGAKRTVSPVKGSPRRRGYGILVEPGDSGPDTRSVVSRR